MHTSSGSGSYFICKIVASEPLLIDGLLRPVYDLFSISIIHTKINIYT